MKFAEKGWNSRARSFTRKRPKWEVGDGKKRVGNNQRSGEKESKGHRLKSKLDRHDLGGPERKRRRGMTWPMRKRGGRKKGTGRKSISAVR